jgi:Flp pilus assembly protein TadD
VLATTLSISPFYVFARYRLPLAPLLLLFAGYAVQRAWRAAQQQRWRSVALGAAAMVPLVLLVHFPIAWFGLVFTDEVGHQNLGFLYVQDGQEEQAEEEFARAIAVNPDLSNAWLMQARLRRSRGDDAGARRSLQGLLEHADIRRRQGTVILDPAAEGEARLRLGRLQRSFREPEEAMAQFRAAADLLQADTTPLIELGITLRGLGRLDQARQAYLHALQRDPDDPLALYNLANVELEEGRRSDATALLRRAAATCSARRPDLCPAVQARLEAVGP